MISLLLLIKNKTRFPAAETAATATQNARSSDSSAHSARFTAFREPSPGKVLPRKEYRPPDNGKLTQHIAFRSLQKPRALRYDDAPERLSTENYHELFHKPT